MNGSASALNLSFMSTACPFCLEEFPNPAALREHPVLCPVMKTFEPKQNCHHCQLSLPVSLCSLHELICPKSKWRIPMTRTNLTYVEIHCPNCDKVGNANLMPKHLSQCLDVLQSQLSNALKNKALNWNLAVYDDYIGKAGLDYWLKAKQH